MLFAIIPLVAQHGVLDSDFDMEGMLDLGGVEEAISTYYPEIVPCFLVYRPHSGSCSEILDDNEGLSAQSKS